MRATRRVTMWRCVAFLSALLIAFPSLVRGQPANYRYKVLSDAHFNEKDLTGANFNYSVISDANFAKAKLQQASIRYTVASDAKFQGADLRGAVFSYSSMACARFTDADCRRANFNYCVLTDADFSGADLRGAIFTKALLGGRYNAKTIYDETTKFPSGFDPVARGLTLKSAQKQAASK